MNKFGKNISKTKMHKILKYELKLRYLKTITKIEKTNSIIVKIMNFFVIKLISRIISLKGNIIYIDEAGFNINNKNFRTWRKKKDTIYNKYLKNDKFNLIMAVTKEKVISYEITKKSTNSDVFQNFMDKLIKSLDEKDLQKSIFFMDNLSAHKTTNLFKFYNDKKLKVIFNTPYISEFNMIEFVFRHIKNYTYKKLYPSIKTLKDDVIKIINDLKNNSTLEKLYKNTLFNYINFFNNNKDLNLNNYLIHK